ncbi:Mth938-like domain-containing protein [Tropicimonas sp. IMCC6043]|uniref:Mth938-like domain-containing protein n=1 Tax=Tropicimonas sp. IMCC6043 TaxID=2510645 RepID=UPI00101DAA0E|nr:Mth938-like domain-containing protein [Tropicimonas sp. IMCC6043]RYH10372.1 hypothetical protein EU800_08785 [Tropicimonas sp. IMCC6043]
MDLEQVTYEDGTPFDSYGPGFFRLGGEVHSGSLVVSRSGIHAWGGFADVDAIMALAGEIDFVLIGTGPEMVPIPTAMRTALESAGIGVELMSTASACRTYNVLLAESRRLAAAVLALPVEGAGPDTGSG